MNSPTHSEHPLVRCEGLTRSFPQKQGLLGAPATLYAVRGVHLHLHRGETLGLVGESGCGKSTLARMLIGMLKPSAGDVFLHGKPLYDKKAHASYKEFQRSLAGRIQMVFQDPYSSLNPRMSVGESIAEPLFCATSWYEGTRPPTATIREKAAAMLERVGLPKVASKRYPHEFSGGQRQRIAIARALITHPDFVVCDEPTSSLDASVQAQVLNLLQDMQEEMGLTTLFISHDLAVVRHMSDRVAVMYQGLVVEQGNAADIFAHPQHPYTHVLLDSIPGAREAVPPLLLAQSQKNSAEPPPIIADSGCPFASRCPAAEAHCLASIPELVPAQANDHSVRCLHPLRRK